MLELLGRRQKEVLQILLKGKTGVTLADLSERLGITRTAVRQHLATLQADRLVAATGTRASGGRPQQLFVLTDKGKELFPRQYSWLARLILESLQAEAGEKGLGVRLAAMGSSVAHQLRRQYPKLATAQQRIYKLSEVMEQLGYDTSAKYSRQDGVIEATNCVFHELALRNPTICKFDLALLSTFAESQVEHDECMARGGHVCRFKFVGAQRRRPE